MEDHEPIELSSAAALAHYLRTAAVLEVLPLPGGGGHGRKRAVYFQGGVGAAAKYGDHTSGSTAQSMIHAEAAASVLASELEWSDLVPTTVLRRLSDPDDAALEVEASVQVLLPRFQTATEGGFDAGSCEPADQLRCAAFDILCLNSDRNNGNWGKFVNGTQPLLIDHGHAFGTHSTQVAGDFFAAANGHALPDDVRQTLEDFLQLETNSDLFKVLEHEKARGVFERARTMVQTGALTAP